MMGTMWFFFLRIGDFFRSFHRNRFWLRFLSRGSDSYEELLFGDAKQTCDITWCRFGLSIEVGSIVVLFLAVTLTQIVIPGSLIQRASLVSHSCAGCASRRA